MRKARTEKQLAAAALLFAALGDPTRLAILRHLTTAGPASISALAANFQTSRQGVTKHLNVLAASGVIAGERRGREHIWTINVRRLADAQRHLDLIARGWDDALLRLKAHIERDS